MAEQSGFMAIQPPIPKAPYATRKIVRGPDGTPQVILVDTATGQTISDPTGYSIVESGTYFDENTLGAQPAPSSKSSEKPGETSAARSVINSTVGRGSDRSNDTGSPSSSGFAGRSQANNYGYIDKPGILGFAGALPGMAGLAGKAVNMGINANNAAASNAARTVMGLPSLSLGGAILGTMKDNKGQVADVQIGGSQYATPVGLEALSPTGQTNMTPAEAAARARATGSIALATQEAIDARNAAFEAEFGKPGLLSRVSGVAKNFIDSMFGSPTPSYYQPDERKSAQIKSQNTGSNFNPTSSGFSDMLGGSSGSGKSNSGSGFNPSRSGFSDMLGGSSGKNATSTSSSAVSGASRSTKGKTSGVGVSPGASKAIGAGKGGLY